MNGRVGGLIDRMAARVLRGRSGGQAETPMTHLSQAATVARDPLDAQPPSPARYLRRG